MSLDLYPPVQRDPLVNPENAAFEDIERDSRFLTATPAMAPNLAAQMPILEASGPPVVALAHQTTENDPNAVNSAGNFQQSIGQMPPEQPTMPPAPGTPGAVSRELVQNFQASHNYRVGHTPPPEFPMPAPEDSNQAAIQATYQAAEAAPAAPSLTPAAQPLYQTAEAAPALSPALQQADLAEQPNLTDIQFSPAPPEPVQPTVAPGLYRLQQPAETATSEEANKRPLSPWGQAALIRLVQRPDIFDYLKAQAKDINNLPLTNQ